MNTIESNSLDALAERINAEHAACAIAASKAIEHAFRAGELLTEAKRHVPHGGWLDWLSKHFAGSVRTAQAYMRVSRELPNAQAAAHSTLDGVLRQLAAPRNAEPEWAASDGPEWVAWQANCNLVGVVPPTPSAFAAWLQAGAASFKLPISQLDDDALRAAHSDCVLHQYAAPLLLSANKYLPAPPTYEPPGRSRRGRWSELQRLQVWQLDAQRAAGGVLNDLASMGLYSDRHGVSLDLARVRVDEARGVCARDCKDWGDVLRSDDDVRAWAVGHAFCALNLPPQWHLGDSPVR